MTTIINNAKYIITDEDLKLACSLANVDLDEARSAHMSHEDKSLEEICMIDFVNDWADFEDKFEEMFEENDEDKIAALKDFIEDRAITWGDWSSERADRGF